MTRLLTILRSTPVRIAFLLIALGFGVFAVVSQWAAIVDAISAAKLWTLPIALLLSALFVVSTFEAWRALMSEGAPGVGILQMARIFFAAQLGKYVPGGIWNFVAASELGKDHDIPRSRSVVVMAASILISMATALGLGVITVLVGPAALRDQLWWVALLLPVFVALLLPRTLNWLIAVLLRRVNRGAVNVRLGARSIGRATAWSLLGWLLAGAQVWMLGVGLGMAPTLTAMAQSVGAYALAWTVGFLAVFAPAGVGVREAVLALTMEGLVTLGATVAIVLLSRVLLSVVDIVLGLAFVVPGSRKRAPAESSET
ncbi:MAG: lysylphosphatidylglycerol synthase domain-containing protein [Pseudoclavibacter sp.]